MAKKKHKFVVDTVKELLEQRDIHPYKIVIFGSYAKRMGHQDSDIDIIVVSKDFEGKGIFKRVNMAKGVHRALVDVIAKPVDIMLYSLSEWQKGRSLIIESAKNEGVIFS